MTEVWNLLKTNIQNKRNISNDPFVKLKNDSPKDMYIKSLESMNVTLFGKRPLEDVTKNLEIKSSWIIKVNPESNDTYPRKRHMENRCTKEKVTMKTEMGSCGHSQGMEC